MLSCQKLATMADVFLDSADVLLKKDKTRFYFVILYMLGTSIELYLKAIIIVNSQESQRTHDLSFLARSANVDAPNFLQTLTHYVYWKSKYHEASKPEHEKDFYDKSNVAVNYDEIINYIKTLRCNYLRDVDAARKND